MLFIGGFVIPTIWSYDPTLLVNLNYQTNISIKEFKEPSLFISNFNNIGHHLDQILICREASNTKIKTNIISWDKESDNFTRLVKKLPLFTKYNLIYTGNKLSEKTKEKLKKEHVWMFLKDDWKNKGAYYILKDLNVPIIFAKLKPDKNIKNTFSRKYNIEYKKVENYDINKSPEDFMKWVKKELYN